MSAYLIGQISVKNGELWQAYVAGVRESLSSYESKIIFRGQLVSILAGKHEHDRVVVIEFIDYPTLKDWYHSEKYQSLIALREKAADVVITTYED